jgi:pyrroloquinoline quinone biosynthesis protein B
MVMRLRVLGAAAGGGVPQWNCRCVLCRYAREAPTRVQPRLHAALAVSADEERWVLCNATPDIQRQIEAFPPLLPREGRRGTSIAAIALSGADLDQVLGLLLLREGEALHIYGTARVRRALDQDLRLLPTLAGYAGSVWHDLALDQAVDVTDRAGTPLGLRIQTFPVLGGPPPYAGRREEGELGDTIGLLLTDVSRGTRAAYVPSCGAIPDSLVALLGSVDCVFFDGTLWEDDDISKLGVPGRTGRSMRHVPLAGEGGTLARLRDLRCRRILTHLNNTNPVLLDGSPEQAVVAASGWEVAYDGMEVVL